MDLSCYTKHYHVVLFQKKKGVKIIAVGIGDNINREFLRKVAGTKGKVITMKSFTELNAKIGEVLDKGCGEWYNLRQTVVIDVSWNRDS